MKKYVALLRGINVGGNKKVSMSELKRIFEECGFSEVSTYINSGNVLFSTDDDEKKLPQKIENILEKSFGFSINVLLRSSENIRNLVEKIPAEWKNDAEMKTDVLFLWEAFDSDATIDMLHLNKNVDTLIYEDGALIWHILRKNYAQSAMHAFIGTRVYKNMTARNINTVRKLAHMLSS